MIIKQNYDEKLKYAIFGFCGNLLFLNKSDIIECYDTNLENEIEHLKDIEKNDVKYLILEWSHRLIFIF